AFRAARVDGAALRVARTALGHGAADAVLAGPPVVVDDARLHARRPHHLRRARLGLLGRRRDARRAADGRQVDQSRILTGAALDRPHAFPASLEVAAELGVSRADPRPSARARRRDRSLMRRATKHGFRRAEFLAIASIALFLAIFAIISAALGME